MSSINRRWRMRPVASLNLPPRVVIVVAARHEDSVSIPRGSSRLLPGDRVVLMGTRDGMSSLREHV